MPGVIVLGYDGSAASVAALHEAARYATALGEKVIVTFGYAVYPVGGETKDQERLLEEMGENATKDAVDYLVGAGVEHEVLIVHDRPAASLLDVAEQRGAGLIVVGTHGENPMIGAILGSVPLKLLHRSKVPVLVVPIPST